MKNVTREFRDCNSYKMNETVAKILINDKHVYNLDIIYYYKQSNMKFSSHRGGKYLSGKNK